MLARLRRWGTAALRFLSEYGSGYYYTGSPADPSWGDRDS